jgi:hypothetical protein
MGKIVYRVPPLRRLAPVALVALLVALAFGGVASAQYRDFSGKIDKLGKTKMIVDNRMGDKVMFERIETTEIEDTSGGDRPKKSWKDLKKDDWVTVQWKMMDKPRKAYRVIVLPPKKEAGDDL